MKKRYKIFILRAVVLASVVLIGWNFEPVRAATRKIVYNVRFNNGLIGYWSFNGADMSGTTATDRGSGGNNGALQNSPEKVPGVSGQALKFNGSSSKVLVPYAASIDTGLSEFTVSFWYKVNQFDPSGNDGLFLKGSGPFNGSGNGWELRMQNGGTTMEFCVNDGVGTCSRASASIAVADALNWHHVTATVSNANTLSSVYIDGVFGGSMAEAPTYTDSYDLNIGRGHDTFLNGTMDEVRVYNRALSAGEIAYLYAKSKPASSGAVGATAKLLTNRNELSGFWDFDDCDTCSSVADRSGNGKTGTMYTTADSVEGDMHTASGKKGNGATFSGSANIAAPNIRIDDRSFSIEFWFNTSNLGSDRALMGQSTIAGCGSRLCLHLATRSSKLLFGFYAEDLAGLTTLTTGRWYHAVFVYDNTAGAKYIYLDGIIDASGASLSYLGTTGNTKFGSDCCDAGFIGTMDEIKMYNRALSAGEVKQAYDNSKKKFLLNMPQNNLIKDGLVGNWSFNGQDMSGVTAYDRSGLGNNGTLTSGPTAVPGIVGQALSFDGSNDYVNVTETSNLPIYSQVTYSISLWVKGATNQTDKRIFAEGSSVSVIPIFTMGTINTGLSDKLDMFIRDDVGVSSMAHKISTGSVFNDEWHHVVWVDDGGAAVLYIDGVADATDFSYTRGTLTLNRTAIGALLRSSAGNFFNGAIDEVRVYNRILSADEILKLYNAGKR